MIVIFFMTVGAVISSLLGVGLFGIIFSLLVGSAFGYIINEVDLYLLRNLY